MIQTATPSPDLKNQQDLGALIEVSAALRRSLAETGGEGGRPWTSIHGLAKLLVHSCQRHIQDAEADNGFLAELERRLGRPHALVVVRGTHQKLLEDAQTLEKELRTEPTESRLKWLIQPMIRQFEEHMEEHRLYEADLLQEAFRDVGAVD